MPLISAAVRTYRTGHVQRVEFLEEGVSGSCALERGDPDRGIPFWGYAVYLVLESDSNTREELTA